MKPVTVNAIEFPAQVPARVEKTTGSTADGFIESLKNAVAKVDALQTSADVVATMLAGGEGNLHETMLALEKADVGMKVALKVRNKIIDAYNDVMRMSV